MIPVNMGILVSQSELCSLVKIMDRTIGAGLKSRLSGTYRFGEPVDRLRLPVVLTI